MNASEAQSVSRSPGAPRVFVFRPRHRLSLDREYQAVFRARARKSHGAIVVFSKPNTLPHHRLGLSVGRRVGNAVARNRAKRMVREAFRQTQASLPMNSQGSGYDFVVQVRPHTPEHLTQYTESLCSAATALHALWTKRLRADCPQSDTQKDTQ